MMHHMEDTRMICRGCGDTIVKTQRPVVAYSGIPAVPSVYHPPCWRVGPTIAPGDTVRIRRGTVGAGYVFVVASIYDNSEATVDPCFQVYGENRYGPVRLHEVEKVERADCHAIKASA
jgi:hypothetical protein